VGVLDPRPGGGALLSSPTSRTLALLRKEGWTAEVTERWNPHSKTRKDLGGGIDVLAWHAGSKHGHFPGEIMGVQACAGASHATRKTKLLKEPKMALWLCARGRLEVWSWSKKGARGKRKLWEVRREELKLADFVPEGG